MMHGMVVEDDWFYVPSQCNWTDAFMSCESFSNFQTQHESSRSNNLNLHPTVIRPDAKATDSKGSETCREECRKNKRSKCVRFAIFQQQIFSVLCIPHTRADGMVGSHLQCRKHISPTSEIFPQKNKTNSPSLLCSMNIGINSYSCVWKCMTSEGSAHIKLKTLQAVLGV